MGLNINQNAIFGTAINGSSQTATITRSRSVSVLTQGGTCTIATLNDSGTIISSLDLPSGSTIKIDADGGNLLQTIRATPNSGATAYITSLGGVITIA
jgi:hypothetical protein